jgi:hypothetical protein
VTRRIQTPQSAISITARDVTAPPSQTSRRGTDSARCRLAHADLDAAVQSGLLYNVGRCMLFPRWHNSIVTGEKKDVDQPSKIR